MQKHFQQVPIDLALHFQNCKHFLKHFEFYLLTTVSTEKPYQVIFLFFIFFQSYNGKSKFSLLQTAQSRSNTSYLRTIHFCIKCQYRFLALILIYTSWYIRRKKIPWKNYVRFWKWNLKHTIGQKFVLEKIKFKVFYYIQHDFIRQCLGLNKDQAGLFKWDLEFPSQKTELKNRVMHYDVIKPR